MRAPALFGIIVLIHATAIGLFSLMQGCATRRPGEGMAGSSAATERASTDTTGPGATLPAATVTSPGLPGTPPPPKRSDTKPVTPPKPALVTHATHVTPTKTPVVTAPKKALPKEGTPYEIKSGDVLSKIAASYGVSTLELASYNGLSNPGAIRKGQKIMIPPGATKKPAATVTASTLSGTPAAAPAAAPVKADEYKVQSGDILGRIAARHGVTTSALKKANNLTSDSLKVGTILKIPAATPATPAAKPAAPDATPVLTPVLPATPTVVTPPPPVHPAPGVDAVVAPAPAPAPDAVAPATPVSSDLSKPFEYVVPDNESLDDIARMFIVTPDSIRKLNSLGPTEAVKAGQRIKIPPSQY
ncbi:MAG: LysM peptidoglycan-binding domain-containing protein [Kiritimatiellia bacterium]